MSIFFDIILHFINNFQGHFSQNLQYEGVIRDINMLSKESPFKLREESGFSVKSSIKHITTIDTRDSKVLANEGIFFQMVMEVAGFGGDVKFLRNYFTSQFYSKISKDVVSCVFDNYLLFIWKVIFFKKKFYEGIPRIIWRRSSH